MQLEMSESGVIVHLSIRMCSYFEVMIGISDETRAARPTNIHDESGHELIDSKA
jgi:hypothetical protein